MTDRAIVDAFIKAACVPMDGSNHVSGGLERAKAILAEHHEVAHENIFTAAILGQSELVARSILDDPESATRKGGPYNWDPLTHLCFSRFLRLRKDETDGFAVSAEMLLEAGADPNTGFYSEEHMPNPVWESAIYGAAGVAHDPRVTKILLDYGADPNDDETPYHAPEWFDNRAMRVLVESGKLNAMSMATLLHRKLDWTDYESVKWLCEKGTDLNLVSHWKQTAIEHSLQRDNRIEFIEVLLDHGGDPTIRNDRFTAVEYAAGMGRGDALRLFEERGFSIDLEDEPEFLAACALGNRDRAVEIALHDPGIVARIESMFPVVMHFAGAGNTEGLRILLDLGFSLDTKSLHAAVWRERTETVKLLLERGADPNARDGQGLTARELAERAQTEMSEWTPHESREILELLGRS